ARAGAPGLRRARATQPPPALPDRRDPRRGRARRVRGAHERAARSLAAVAGPPVGDRSARAALLRRAQRAVCIACLAAGLKPDSAHLGRAVAAGTARPARGDRAAAGRGAPALAAFLDTGGAAV